MNTRAAVLVVAIVVGGAASLATGQPLATVATSTDGGGWFTTENLAGYGDDLDDRLAPGGRVFTGHPAYLINSQNARLLFDRPRLHYYTLTFRGTALADEQYRQLATALSNGSAPYAINNTMTANMLRWDGATPAREAFEANYCRVDDGATQRLYGRTNATLYRYTSECQPGHRPRIGT